MIILEGYSFLNVILRHSTKVDVKFVKILNVKNLKFLENEIMELNKEIKTLKHSNMKALVLFFDCLSNCFGNKVNIAWIKCRD